MSLALSLSATAYSREALVWSPSGKRVVPHYSLEKGRPSIETTEKSYGFAIFSTPQSKNTRDRTRSQCQVDILSAYDVLEGFIIYEAAFYGGYGRAKTCLSSAAVGFHNIQKESAPDKLAPKISGRQSLELGEYDEKDGQAFASVSFHQDVPNDHARKLLANSAMTILHQTHGNVIVKGPRGILQSLANLPEIMGIHAYNSLIRPTLNQSRAKIGVDSIQNIDTTNIYPPSTTWMTGPNDTLTGDSIIVGVYDTGIDSLVLDFKERTDTDTILRRADTSLSWATPSGNHGTLIASICCGNG